MASKDDLFTLFGAIERSGKFSATDLARILGVKWDAPDESNRPYFFVYKKRVDAGPYKGLLARVEARIPDIMGTVRMLNLDFLAGVSLSREEIEAKYKVVEFEPASATAPAEVPDMLTVRRSWGSIVFGLRDRVKSVSFQVGAD